MIVELHVQPRARRNALVRTADGGWKLYLIAPPVEGRANKALVEYFVKGVGISRSRVNIVSGERSRRKVVALEGVEEEQLLRLTTPG